MSAAVSMEPGAYVEWCRVGLAGQGFEMRDTKKIARKLAQIASTQLDDDFENIKILDVKAELGVDEDGEPVVKIFVVFEGDPKSADIAKLSGIERRVRLKFEEEAHDDAFPVFSFISKEDAKSMNFEAA